MRRVFDAYLARAAGILEHNWAGAYTRPAPQLYPHQWNWDSGFIAMGLAHIAPERAMRELESLFAAQWHNGMLPQIVFNPDSLGHYFPEPDFWQTERSPHAPAGVLTSGITMPPIQALAALKIYRHARRRSAAVEFLRRVYPRLLAAHACLYRERDPRGEGLVYIRHPWESGLDNSPVWDIPLRRIRVANLPPYRRRDLESGVDPAMRPGDDDYDRYVYLVDLFRRLDYDEAAIGRECPFLIQDPLFNAILLRADEALLEIAGLLGEPDLEIRDWRDRTRSAIRSKLWSKEQGRFAAYDLASGELLRSDSAAGFMPLFGGAATAEQATRIYERLNSYSFCALNQGNCFTIPNYDTRTDDFDRRNYWRGPVWININWMLAQGLRRYGYTLKADSLQKDLLQLPIRFGFHEYFDSFDGTGYGSDDFSWTAALFIDLVKDFYGRERPAPGRVIKGWLGGEVVLNAGHHDEQPADERLASELLQIMRTIREGYYNCDRGLVDYDALYDSPEYRHYRELTGRLQNFDPDRLAGRRRKLAFWINLYNSIVIDGIIELRLRHSVREFPGFFRRIKYRIGHELFSPDDMEHGILRANVRRIRRRFGPRDRRSRHLVIPPDPRIHFALVCGSRSCAPIEFYDPEHIHDQLETAAGSFINSSEVLILPEEGRILMSEIFRWYRVDFGGRDGVLDFIHDYHRDAAAREFIAAERATLEIEYLYYDWNLNR